MTDAQLDGPSSGVIIAPTSGPDDARAVARLVWEFFDLLRVRYPEMQAGIDDYIAIQDVAGELERLANGNPSSGGVCLLARLDGDPVGVLMMKPYGPDTCEMNRMYVSEKARGKGVGRLLAIRLFDEARERGYRIMRLDAADQHVEALPLYRSLGFEPDPNPPDYAKTNPRILSFRLTL